MGTNRNKAVKDRPHHREKVEKWHAKVADRVARRLAGKVAVRLKGKGGSDGKA